MGDAISVTISVFALCLSVLTAWLTLFRRGTVKMTQPTVIYLGPDSPRARDESPLPKVFLRTLLFATSKRGRIAYCAFPKRDTAELQHLGLRR